MDSAYTTIGVRDVARLLKDPNFLFIDVREPEECADGMPQGAENVPLGSISLWIEDAGVDQTTPIAFICRSGGRSAAAATLVHEHGFENLYNIAGGYIDWVNEGLPSSLPESD
jgi:rhodanese-related sulfurtransferase